MSKVLVEPVFHAKLQSRFFALVQVTAMGNNCPKLVQFGENLSNSFLAPNLVLKILPVCIEYHLEMPEGCVVQRLTGPD